MQQDIAHDVLLIRAAIVGEVVTEKRDDQTDVLLATCANVNVASASLLRLQCDSGRAELYGPHPAGYVGL